MKREERKALEADTVKNLVLGILNYSGDNREIDAIYVNQEIQKFVDDCSNHIIGEMQKRHI